MKYIQADWPAPANIQAYTTTRIGWGGPTSDKETIVSAIPNLPEQPHWLKQTHSNIALEAMPAHAGQPGDACFTSQRGRVCAVITADCLPVLICDRQGTHVAAIHAGWRGLASGVIDNTLKALNLPGTELLAWLGPAIGPDKFEVGSDVLEAFLAVHQSAESAFRPLGKQKYLANLYELATIRLREYGITSIHGGNYCTHTQTDWFYSYRRDNGNTGRMASVIWIENHENLLI